MEESVDLVADAWLHVMSFCSARELLALGCTCRTMYQLCDVCPRWKTLFELHRPKAHPLAGPREKSATRGSWMRRYAGLRSGIALFIAEAKIDPSVSNFAMTIEVHDRRTFPRDASLRDVHRTACFLCSRAPQHAAVVVAACEQRPGSVPCGILFAPAISGDAIHAPPGDDGVRAMRTLAERVENSRRSFLQPAARGGVVFVITSSVIRHIELNVVDGVLKAAEAWRLAPKERFSMPSGGRRTASLRFY